jgi:hypothetical protein
MDAGAGKEKNKTCGAILEDQAAALVITSDDIAYQVDGHVLAGVPDVCNMVESSESGVVGAPELDEGERLFRC